MDQLADTTGAGRRRALFEEALGQIESGYDDHRLTVDGLSQRIFTSRRQLQRAFAESGTSFQERLHAVRMERAAELLHKSSLTVTEIAGSVGYRQPAQFAKAFRRYYQLAPTQWRNSTSNPATAEVISVDCQCGCATSAPDGEAPQVQPRPARNEQERDLKRRLQEVDRRLQELGVAA